MPTMMLQLRFILCECVVMFHAQVYRGMQWASRTQLEDQNSEEYKVVSKLLFVSDRVLASDPNTSEEVRLNQEQR